MAKGINKVILVGTLGKDPEIKYTSGGSAVANISLATNERWKDKEGQTQERTEWHRIVIWGKLAEIAAEYLKKGAQAYFEGKIQTRKWQDQSGQDRYSTEIVAHEMQMLGGRTDSQNQSNDRSGSHSRSSGAQPRQQSQDRREPEGGFDNIPF